MAGAPSGAYDRVLLSMTYEVSGNNLSADSDQFIFVKCGNTENEVVPAAAGDVPMGISYSTGKDGNAIEVAMSGVAKLRLAGTVKRGNLVKVNSGTSDGRGILSTNIAAYGGMALRDGVSGDIIPVLLLQGHGS